MFTNAEGTDEVRQFPLQESAQISRRGGRSRTLGYDIRHQASFARPVFAHDHTRLLNRGMLRQHRLDLSRFNSESAKLDLLIESA